MEQEQPKKRSKRKLTKAQKAKIRRLRIMRRVIIVAAFLLIVAGIILGIHHFLGSNGEKNNTASATPTVTPKPTSTPKPKYTPTPTASPTPTSTPTPTFTPTPTTPPGTPTPTPDDGRKLIAFTFDDGPYSKLTPLFVEKLKEYNGKATWFVVGNRINETTGPQLRAAAEAGMLIEIHAWTHDKYFDKCNDDTYRSEVDKTYDKIMEATGIAPIMMRPPGGRISTERVTKSPLYIVNWSIDSEDWKLKGRSTEEERQKNVNQIVNNVMNAASRGKIILMHEIYDNSYEAFCIIIDKLSQQGYEFVTVAELIGEDAELGKIYTKRP